MITDYLAAHHLLGSYDAVSNALTLAIFLGVLFGIGLGCLIAHGIHSSGTWERQFRAEMEQADRRHQSFQAGILYGRSRPLLMTMEAGAWD